MVSHVQRALAASRVANLVEADRTVFTPGSTLQPFPDGLVGSAAGAGSPQWNAGYTLRWIYHGSDGAFLVHGQRAARLRLGDHPGGQNHRGDLRERHLVERAGSQPGREPGAALRAAASGANEIALGGGAGNGWPAFIRSQLACGAYTVAGRQVIDGIDTIKITGTSSPFTFWVNPVNYLPVAANLGHRQTDFHWLPATPANLARLKVTVPAGFKQVPAPPPPAAHAP